MHQALQHFDIFSPVGNENVTTDDVLSILPYFLPHTLQKCDNKVTISSEQDKQHFMYIYTVYHEGNKMSGSVKLHIGDLWSKLKNLGSFSTLRRGDLFALEHLYVGPFTIPLYPWFCFNIQT